METKVNIGDMDVLITLYQPTNTSGTQGELIITYVAVAVQYAAREDATTSEVQSDNNVNTERTPQITIYKSYPLDTRWRIGMAGKTYNITAIDTLARVSPFQKLSLSEVV